MRGGRVILVYSFPQILGKVYSVLSDKEQRTLYDEQGTVDEEELDMSERLSTRALWKTVGP